MRWLLFAAAAAVVATGTWSVVTNLPETAANAQGLTSREQRVDLTATLAAITVDGERGLPIADLRSVSTTQLGQRVDMKQLASDRDAMEIELASRGYLAAKVGEPAVTYADGNAYVVFDVIRGPLFRLRSVTITGPGRIDADVVLLAAGDQALRGRMTQARESLAAALARRGVKDANVELMVHDDRDAAMVDVELVTH